jgi:ABC transporter substrate binding protein
VSRAQQTGKVWRIGYLGLASAAAQSDRIQAMQAGLQALGYVEGANIIIEYRWAEGRYDGLSDLASELVQLDVDVIVTHATPGVLAVQKATASVPIVMAARAARCSIPDLMLRRRRPEDLEAYANGPREDDIRRHSIGEAQGQNPWQPAVRKFEDHKDDQPDADDAQPQDQQALQ